MDTKSVMQQSNKNMNNNFCFFIYTNEKYQCIADLTMGEFDKFVPENPLKRYVVSNKFKDYEFKSKNAIFIDCNEEFNGSGNHFGQTMIKALNQINEKYIIFFCDDYMLIDQPKMDVLGELMKKIEEQNINFFSFASMYPKQDWKKYDLNFEAISGRTFYEISNDCQHLYSVQPCIWDKESLLEILKYNPHMSLHDLDTTNIKNREGLMRTMNVEKGRWNPYPSGSQDYGLKNICTDYLGYDEYHNGFDYFVFPYVEIIRWGFFNMFEKTNTKRFLEKFFVEKNIPNDENLKNFIHP